MLRGVPIKISAPVLITLPVLLLGLGLSLYWRSNSGDAIRTVAEQGISEIHTLAGTRVRSLLAMPPRICRLNRHLIEQGVLDPDTLEDWFPIMSDQIEEFEMLSAVGWGSPDGRAAWVTRYADGQTYWALESDPGDPEMLEWRITEMGTIPDQPTGTFEFDLFTRPWYTTPIESGQGAWTDPYLWIGGVDGTSITLGISYGIPITNGSGTMLGVIDADYSLNDLSKFLSTIEIGPNGLLALIDGSGTLIAGSGRVSPIDEQGNRFSVDDPAHPILAAAAPYLIGEQAQRGRLSPITIGADTYLLRASEVGTDLGIDWILVTAAAQRDYTGDIEQGFRNSFILTSLIVLLIVLAGIIVARWLVRPIATLVGAAQRVGSGDLDFDIEIDHAPEYANLSNAMNTMIDDLRDRMRMRRSLMLAQEVQKNLLPDHEPSIKGLDIVGHSTYCDETGGDYYDFLHVIGGDENEVVVALGDVMGHGVAAAMLMATARGILRSRCAVEGSLAEFLEHLNKLLIPDTRGERFMTMLLATINATTHRMRWASAGHGAPIIYDGANDRFIDLDGGGVPLGIFADAEYEEYTLDKIEHGMIILIATDGLWEAKSHIDGELFGMERLREMLRTLAPRTAREISDTLRDTISEFQGEDGQDDDVTYVVVKIP